MIKLMQQKAYHVINKYARIKDQDSSFKDQDRSLTHFNLHPYWFLVFDKSTELQTKLKQLQKFPEPFQNDTLRRVIN